MALRIDRRKKYIVDRPEPLPTGGSFLPNSTSELVKMRATNRRRNLKMAEENSAKHQNQSAIIVRTRMLRRFLIGIYRCLAPFGLFSHSAIMCHPRRPARTWGDAHKAKQSIDGNHRIGSLRPSDSSSECLVFERAIAPLFGRIAQHVDALRF